MTNRFIHVGCMFPHIPRTAEVDAVLGSVSDDWIRYATNNWVLWTNRSASDIYNTVKPRLGPQDQMLIVAMDMTDRNGFLSQWIWDWIASKKSAMPRTLGDILSDYTAKDKEQQPGFGKGFNGLLGNPPFSNRPKK